MGSLAQDRDAAISLVTVEYLELKNSNPKHDLLKYLSGVDENEIRYSKENVHEFLDKFETPEEKKEGHTFLTKVLSRYYLALREANEEIKNPSMLKKEKKNLTDSI